MRFPFSSPPEVKFWKWFAQNAERLKTIATGTEPIVEELSRELHKVHPDIAWELGGGETGYEIILSAEGVQDVAPAVTKLVAASPELAGWKVTAFRQRNPGARVRVGERTVDATDLFFSVMDASGQALDLKIFMESFNEEDSSLQIGFLMLDSVLGELDVMTHLGHLEFAPLIDADGRQRPLPELAALVDSRKGR